MDKKRALFRSEQEYSLFAAEPYHYAKGAVSDEFKDITAYGDVPFYKKQVKICLRNAGTINPESIEEYIAMGGYAALAKAVTQMTSEQVIHEVTKSNLRGRGGGGFPPAKSGPNAGKPPASSAMCCAT